MAENSSSLYDLVPELGDLVSFVSEIYTLTTGRIIYRSTELIRIRPMNASHRAVDFPLIPETGLFNESLGVSEVLMHEKRRTPHFAKQLSTVIGEYLDFYHADGTVAAESGIVHEIYATEEQDGIKLEDGRILDFGFIGSQSPLDVLRPRAAPEAEAPPENNSMETIVEETTTELHPEIDFSTLPAALVEEVPTQERTYSDSVQREDMFVSMLVDVPLKRQKDPRVMQELYRLTDILLALKNSVILRDQSGNALPGNRSYVATTIKEAIAKQPTGNPIGAVIPVVAVKKVLYTDDEGEGGEDLHIEKDTIELRHDTKTLLETLNVVDFTNQGATNAFIAHIHKTLQGLAAYVPATSSRLQTRVDQDVLCTRMPYEPIEGFPTTPPGWEKKRFGTGGIMPLTMDSLGEIENRYARMLTGSTIRDTKTNATYTVSPADSADTIGHVLLSESLAAQRAPIRSKVLLWDIAYSQYSRSRTRSFHNTFATTPEDQLIMNTTDNHTIAAIITERLHPTTSFINYETSQLYDTLGLHDLELTEALLVPLDVSLKVGTQLWDKARKERATRAAAAGKHPSVPPILAAVANFSTHIKPTETYPSFTEALKSLTEKETALTGYDLAIVSELTSAAGFTLGAYWNTILGEAPKDRIERAERAFLAETGRKKQLQQRKIIQARAFSAMPELNTCPHVHDLERVYSVRQDDQRMVLFEKCYDKYQAGQRGNYILCGTCGKDFVCKHEVLLLNEFLHPGRGAALHKSLLLEYAGPVFEGAYICKTCGQKITEIEYDTHLEFDDEGRPLVGRNVVEEDTEDDIDLALVIRDEVVDKLPFEKNELPLYYIARTICEAAGFTFPIETYRRIVDGYNAFFETLSQRDDYDKKRQAEEKAAKKGTIVRAPYDNYIATYKVAGLGALTVLEVQTSGMVPPAAMGGCVFRSDGFPLDDEATVGTGAMTYISCIVANIMRNDAPWNRTSWSAESNMTKRVTMISASLKPILNRLLGLRPGQTPLSMTDFYRDRLTAERTRKLASGTQQVRQSDADTLPPSFRPLQRIVLPDTKDEKPVGNVQQFLGAVATAPIMELRPFVDKRSEQLSLHLLNDSNGLSKKGAVEVAPKRSDASCCFTKLSDVAVHGLGVLTNASNESHQKEYELQAAAKRMLENRDPATPASGTHFYVPWSAPPQTTVVPGADPSMYYKVFVKHCYKGERYGRAHELNVNSICRRCGFQYPAEIDLIDSSEKGADKIREELCLAALSTSGVEINEETYTHLDRQIKQIKTIVPPVPVVDTNFQAELMKMGAMLTGVQGDRDIELLVATMTDIQSKGLREVARRAKFAEISKRYDAVRARFAACFPTPEIAAGVLAGIDTLTEKTTGSVGVRNLVQTFVVQGTQIAARFTHLRPAGRKWFHSVSHNHQLLLDKIWEKSATTVTNNLKELAELDDTEITTIRHILTQYTETFSHVYDIWITELRSNIHFTDTEYNIVLCWFTLSGLLALMSTDSIYYRDIESASEKTTAVKFFQTWIQRSVQSYAESSQRYQLTAAQVAEAINARAELEKSYFIKRFDDLDRDMRAVEKIKKGLKIGDWAVGTVKNLFSYNAEFFEFERTQRAAMGLTEFGVTEAGGEHNQARQGIIDGGYENRGAQDEDV